MSSVMNTHTHCHPRICTHICTICTHIFTRLVSQQNMGLLNFSRIPLISRPVYTNIFYFPIYYINTHTVCNTLQHIATHCNTM